jgi:hypothetical protein
MPVFLYAKFICDICGEICDAHLELPNNGNEFALQKGWEKVGPSLCVTEKFRGKTLFCCSKECKSKARETLNLIPEEKLG